MTAGNARRPPTSRPVLLSIRQGPKKGICRNLWKSFRAGDGVGVAAALTLISSRLRILQAPASRIDR
jgi:hypothetical protein